MAAETMIRSISCSLQLRLKSNDSKKFGEKTVKIYGCSDIVIFSQAGVIIIQENAAFKQVLIYQDWHNQLLNTINFILLLNFKESFFNYLNLGEKVADFSERSSQCFSSVLGTY